MNNRYSPQDKIKQESTFGKWHVSMSGEMTYNNGKYFIESSRLDKENWIAHLFEKGGIDWNEFIPAYFQALKNAGIQRKNMLIFY